LSVHNKAAVVVAVRSRRPGRIEAYDQYMLSEEEFFAWEEAFDTDAACHDPIARVAFAPEADFIIGLARYTMRIRARSGV
jgi:hypothetical protein